MQLRCPECGALVPSNETCQSNLHALFCRESEVAQLIPDFFSTPSGQTAHFFAISCYAIQHASSMGYTVASLLSARDNVALRLNGAASMEELRTKVRKVADGQHRVLRRDGDPIHDWRVEHWPFTVEHVLAAEPLSYADATRQWAHHTIAAIQQAT